MFAAFSSNLFGSALLSFAIATGAATGKLAFDSLVQREAPDANYGRSFARFEARFQFAWVVGAFIPAVVHLSIPVGGSGVAAAALFALFSYAIGRPGRSALSWRPKIGGGDPSAIVASESAPDPEADPEQTTELTLEDLRPTQPQAPDGTSEWAAGWDSLPSPIVSSVEGVEVDPTPRAPSPSDDSDDQDAGSVR